MKDVTFLSFEKDKIRRYLKQSRPEHKLRNTGLSNLLDN